MALYLIQCYQMSNVGGVKKKESHRTSKSSDKNWYPIKSAKLSDMNIIYNSSEHVNEVSSYYSVLYTNQFVYTF